MAAVCVDEVLRRSTRKRTQAEREAQLLEAQLPVVTSSNSDAPDEKRDRKQPKSAKKDRAQDSESRKGLNGVKRIMAEFQAMQTAIEENGGRVPCGAAMMHDLTFHEDQAHTWRLKLSNFDSDSEAGRQLNKDLKKLETQKPGSGCVEFEVRFPKDYPRHPFFLRVIRPRMQMYTGHITAGGSVCMQSLATGSAQGNWQASFSVEGILTLVTANMLDEERIEVVTATGPGGLSGPARVDFPRAHHEYGMHEAEAAFRRMEQHHKVHGW